MNTLAVLFGFYLLFGGIELVPVFAASAHRLDVPGSEFIDTVYWSAFAAYVVAVFVIIKFKVRWRWAWFVGAAVLGLMGLMYSSEIVQRGSVRIPLSAPLNRESKQAFEAKYPVKWIADSRSVRVRRDDYSPELAAFVADLAAHQVKQGSGAGQ
jgi:hypothetical protein